MNIKSLKIIAFFSAAALCLSACQKEGFRFREGDAVRFSVGSAGTKAAYSGDAGSETGINWQENDTLRIYCTAVSEPECKYADYRVSSVESTPSKARISGLGGVGLRWGAGEHTFYAAWPSPAVNGITTDVIANTVAASLPAEQAVAGDITETTSGNYVAAPDLKNMLMTATTTCTESTMPGDGAVFLNFTPLTTAIQFTVTNQTKAGLEIKSVSLTSASSPLNGPFTVDISSSSTPEAVDTDGDGTKNITYNNNYPACQYTGTVSDASRTVTIHFDSPVELAYDEDVAKCGTLTFTFFLQPCQNFDDLTFKFVKSDDSSLSTRIGYLDGTGVRFPRFMKSYVTGLFIPEGAQWTVKYGPEVLPWAEQQEALEPSPETDPMPFVTQWVTGTDEDIEMLKYSYTMDVAGEIYFGHEGTNGTPTELALTSFREYGHASSPVVWNLEYYDETAASWKAVKSGETISDLVTIGMTGIEEGGSILGKGAATLSMNVVPAEPTAVGTHTERLLNAVQKGFESAPYDLSMHTIYGDARTRAKTANSYIINAQGWYAFPLVYGNAIDDNVAPAGFINVNAYNPGGETDPTSTILTRFKNYRGEGIRLPYIEEDLETAADGWTASVLWSDASFIDTPCQILNASSAGAVGLTANPCGYVLFHVNGNIRQGNAVIAIKDGDGEIIWSWHIWITDDELDPVTFVNHNGQACKFLPLNLGWVDSSDETVEYYSGKSVQFRIIQEGSGLQKEFTVTRRPENAASHESGTSTYYQWGRKDPFRPSDISTTALSTTTDIAWSIKHPDKYVTGGECYYSESVSTDAAHYYNLWSSLNKGLGTSSSNYANGTIKTIYDPCPPGFQIPHGMAFTGLTTTGSNSTVTGEFNVDGVFGAGWYFRTGAGLETNFFKAAGLLSAGGVYGEAGETGYYWTSVPQSGTGAAISGQEMDFGSTSVHVVNGMSQASGCTVRPIMEQHL